jgi:hypothetical protein
MRAFTVRPAMQNRIDLNPEIPTFTTSYPWLLELSSSITNKTPAILFKAVSLFLYVFQSVYNQMSKNYDTT